jgi:hypothetical protein
MNSWPFSDSPNLAVIVDRAILFRGKWVGYVSHDIDDGCWQFHTGEGGAIEPQEAAVVCLGDMLELDPTLSELADLPLGWSAWRQSINSPWQREKTADVDE